MSVLISGSIAYDTIMNFHDSFANHFKAHQLHELNVSFNVQEMVRYAWWTAHNIAYAMNQCGQTWILVAAVGIDFVTPPQCAELDYTHVQYAQCLTAQATMMTDQDGNQISSFYPWASWLWLESDISGIDKITLWIVSPNNPKTMLKHCRQLHDRAVPFFFDPWQVIRAFDAKDLEEVIDLAPYLIVNQYEKQIFCEIVGVDFETLCMSFEKVIVTAWEQWVELWEWNHVNHFAAVVVEKVEDPTGAWDALRWGLLAWLYEWKTWKESIDQWQQLASLCIQHKWTMQRKTAI